MQQIVRKVIRVMQYMQQNKSFNIKIAKFEGPFDLLLFFIERDELDIYDIPIAQITSDFLNYMHTAKGMNIDLAGDFIVVAATLMRIKAKMLIPRQVINEAGEEIDPREELTNQLLEYKRFKDILDEMRRLETDRALREERGNVTEELQNLATTALVDVELQNLTLFKLLRTFERLLKQFETQKSTFIHEVAEYKYSIETQRVFLLAQLDRKSKLDFADVFKNLEDRMHAVVTFLALLEMINQQIIKIQSARTLNSFWIYKTAPEEI